MTPATTLRRVPLAGAPLAGAALLAASCAGFLAGPGCSETTIALKEQFGYAKREQLVDRVEEARDEQVGAKKQFASALQEFMAVTGAQGGDLEARYDKLKKEYDRSESRAGDVRSRIADVKRVGEALFKEWRQELGQYTNPDLRRASEQELQSTRDRYDRLVSSMQNAADKMTPVLAAFKDQVLFLKHNLNARAIASLQGPARQIELDVSGLIKEMEAAIAESNDFIAQMGRAAA